MKKEYVELFFKDHSSLEYYGVWDHFRTRETDNKLYMLVNRISEMRDGKMYLIGYIGEYREEPKEQWEDQYAKLDRANG